MEQAQDTEQKTGKVRSGWALTKSAWQVFKLDKELAWIQFLGVVASVVAVMVVGAAFLAIIAAVVPDGASANSEAGIPLPLYIAGYLIFGTLGAFIVNLFGGAVIYGAADRFNGGDPTVKSSLSNAWKRWKQLALFSLMMTTVGLVLQLIAERVPFAGRIAVWLVGAAWNIANFFAVPAIVLDKEVPNNPTYATKRSVSIIKQVWGEGVVAQIGIGVIAALSYLGYIAASVVLVAVMASLAPVAAVGLGALLIIGFFGLALLFTTLSSIIKAALYYMAMTGEAPEAFNKRLLQQSFGPKKAAKVPAQ